MEEYIGQACLHCGKAFTAEDDIVSCPECGTPYHRACWKETGRCINDTLHEKGESWISQRKHQIIKERSAEKQAEEFEQAALRERGESPQFINATLYDGARLLGVHVRICRGRLAAGDDVERHNELISAFDRRRGVRCEREPQGRAK